jgi:hypothetical protein
VRVYGKNQRHSCGRVVKHSVTKTIETFAEDIVDVEVCRRNIASLDDARLRSVLGVNNILGIDPTRGVRRLTACWNAALPAQSLCSKVAVQFRHSHSAWHQKKCQPRCMFQEDVYSERFPQSGELLVLARTASAATMTSVMVVLCQGDENTETEVPSSTTFCAV